MDGMRRLRRFEGIRGHRRRVRRPRAHRKLLARQARILQQQHFPCGCEVWWRRRPEQRPRTRAASAVFIPGAPTSGGMGSRGPRDRRVAPPRARVRAGAGDRARSCRADRRGLRHRQCVARVTSDPAFQRTAEHHGAERRTRAVMGACQPDCESSLVQAMRLPNASQIDDWRGCRNDEVRPVDGWPPYCGGLGTGAASAPGAALHRTDSRT